MIYLSPYYFGYFEKPTDYGAKTHAWRRKLGDPHPYVRIFYSIKYNEYYSSAYGQAGKSIKDVAKALDECLLRRGCVFLTQEKFEKLEILV